MGGTRSIETRPRRVSRRLFLASGLGLVSAGAVCERLYAAPQQVRFPTNPFTLGVASGDPDSAGVVIWTRLAPDPLRGGGMPPHPVEITWQVAADEHLAKIIRRGRAIARAESAHAVHVDVEGLEPARWYWYQFRVGDELSPVGRTRTLPRERAPADRLRFAFVSCQHWEQGYYTAYEHAAAADLDLIFHLGDYIYEGPGAEGRVRRHVGPDLFTLEQYRNRYAQYKTDPDLRLAHAACPWIVTWDDHEVDGNYAAEIPDDDQPVEAFLMRRAAAYQAYYEHMPLGRGSRLAGASMRIYRRFSFGSLASFFVLDTRQYRTDQPCGDGQQEPCPGVFDHTATLLGADQERWLLGGLDRSRTRWNVLPQQVMMAPVDQAPGADERHSMDQWPGYDVERKRLLEFFATRRPANPVVLSGDVHTNWVNDLNVDSSNPKSPVVATEFVGTSISSGGDGTDRPGSANTVLAENPFVKFFNSQRGYVACDVTPKMMRAQFRVLDYVSRRGSPCRTRAAFVVEDGKPGAQAAEGA